MFLSPWRSSLIWGRRGGGRVIWGRTPTLKTRDQWRMMKWKSSGIRELYTCRVVRVRPSAGYVFHRTRVGVPKVCFSLVRPSWLVAEECVEDRGVQRVIRASVAIGSRNVCMRRGVAKVCGPVAIGTSSSSLTLATCAPFGRRSTSEDVS